MSDPVSSMLVQEGLRGPHLIPAVYAYEDDDASSESSDGSYTSTEYQMGLDHFNQRSERELAYPFNPDGTCCLSPLVLDQIALLTEHELPEIENDIEVENLLTMIENDVEISSPQGESAIDLADAIDDGRFNPWDDRPSELTSSDRVRLWLAKGPGMSFLEHISIDDFQEDSTPCACNLNPSEIDSDDDIPCVGEFCALIKPGSSERQIARAQELAAARIKDDEVRLRVEERLRNAKEWGCDEDSIYSDEVVQAKDLGCDGERIYSDEDQLVERDHEDEGVQESEVPKWYDDYNQFYDYFPEDEEEGEEILITEGVEGYDVEESQVGKVEV
jgi:hypothetical protein